MKTSQLTGAALDWAVSKCWGIVWEQGDLDAGEYGPGFRPSTDWEDGGPIIEKHGIHLEWSESHEHWLAYSWDRFSNPNHHMTDGDTALIAAMRCYVASKLGDEVDVPRELT